MSLLLDALFHASKQRERWIPLLDVGPFACLDHAKQFAQEWMDGARGVESRLHFGEQLYDRYKASVDSCITLSLQCVSIDTYNKNRQWDDYSRHAGSETLVYNVKQIQAIEKTREK